MCANGNKKDSDKAKVNDSMDRNSSNAFLHVPKVRPSPFING